MCLEFLKAWIAKSLFFSVLERFDVAGRSVHTMMNPYIVFLTCSGVYCSWGQSVCGALERVNIFSG